MDGGVMDDVDGGPRSRGPDRRRLAGTAALAALIAGLVPAFLGLTPRSDWHRPLLLVTLAALAVVADRAEVPLPSTTRMDATIALALISVALLGPLPAFLVALAPLVAGAVTGHDKLVRPGNFANIAAYGWE